MDITTIWANISSKLLRPVFGYQQRRKAGDGPPPLEIETLGFPGTASGRETAKTPTGKENKDLARLVDEIESDYQFKFARDTIAALITTNPVVFQPADGHETDSRLAAICENANALWKAKIHDALKSFSYGRAAFEKAYEHSPDKDALLLSKLDYIDFVGSEMVLEDGCFAGVKVGKETLPTEAVWWLAIDPTPQNPHGRSRYAGAPAKVREWRKVLEEQERTWYRRFAIGQGVARFPEPSGPNTTLTENHPRTALASQLADIESGGSLLLSSQQYTTQDGSPSGVYQYDFTPSDGLRDGSALKVRRDSLDVCTLRAMSIPEMALQNNGDTGTFAMAEAHQTLLWANADQLQAQIVESFKKYVVDKIVAYNYVGVDGEAIAAMTVAVWTTRLDQFKEATKAAKSAAAQPPAVPFSPYRGAIGSNGHTNGNGKPLPARVVKTDEQIAAAGQRDAKAIYADLQAILSDRVAMKDAVQHPMSAARGRL